MAHFAVTVPDNKISDFKEYMNKLNFVHFEETPEFDLSDAHKEILDQRLENYKNNPESYLDWEDVQKEINNRTFR